MRYLADVLYIEKFRKFTNKEIKLGKKINVFSGQNGVGKSNLLSLIATTFGTKEKIEELLEVIFSQNLVIILL